MNTTQLLDAIKQHKKTHDYLMKAFSIYLNGESSQTDAPDPSFINPDLPTQFSFSFVGPPSVSVLVPRIEDDGFGDLSLLTEESSLLLSELTDEGVKAHKKKIKAYQKLARAKLKKQKLKDKNSEYKAALRLVKSYEKKQQKAHVDSFNKSFTKNLERLNVNSRPLRKASEAAADWIESLIELPKKRKAPKCKKD